MRMIYTACLFLFAVICFVGAAPVAEQADRFGIPSLGVFHDYKAKGSVQDWKSQLAGAVIDYGLSRLRQNPSSKVAQKAGLSDIDVGDVITIGKSLANLFDAYRGGGNQAEAEDDKISLLVPLLDNLYETYKNQQNGDNQVAESEFWLSSAIPIVLKAYDMYQNGK